MLRTKAFTPPGIPIHREVEVILQSSQHGQSEMDTQAPGSLLSSPELSPLEQEVLEEYERLAENMKKLATILDAMADHPTTEILDGLRELERKTSLVFTLLKASVYSIVLQQEIGWGDPAQAQAQAQAQGHAQAGAGNDGDEGDDGD
ncbi:hypothetical protein DL769_006928 [Monosporascus sp. CRB-8-3]|nr:hypothetical protein DL769_006928 [Monosporascus sp. CRB-8-3]